MSKTYYVGLIPVSDELYHYGIKGQKWGVRRYQNLDGTLTPAGKERYKTTSSSLEHEKAYYHYADKYYTNKKYRRKVDNLLNNGSTYSNTINLLSHDVKTKEDKLNNMFWAHDNELKDSGNPWSGDGTELHWFLEDNYPDYAKASKDYEDSVTQLCNQIKKSVKSGMFDSLFTDNTPGLMYRYDSKRYSYSSSSDGRAIALAYMIGIRDNTDLGYGMEERARETKRK